MIAFVESREAKLVAANRARGEADDDQTEEWEELQGELDLEREGWSKRVESTVPDVEEDRCCQMVRALAKEVAELKKLVVAGDADGEAGPEGGPEADLLGIGAEP